MLWKHNRIVAKKPLGIWYKFPIRFRPVRIPSMSRQCPVNISPAYNNPPTAQSAVHASSAYLTIINQSVHRSFFYIFPQYSSTYIFEYGKRRGTPIICRFRILSQSPPSKRTAHSRIVSRFFCISAGYTQKLR